MTPQSFYTCFQKASYAGKLLQTVVMKRNMTIPKPRSSFFIPFLKNKSKIMSVIVNAILMTRLSKISRISFRVTMMQTYQKRMTAQLTVKMTKAKPLVVSASLSKK